MKYPLIAAILASFICIFAACDNTSAIGNSLSDNPVEIIIDSNFVVTGQSVDNPVVQSRTLSQLIGSLNAKEFGAIHSDFVAQFMPSLGLDTANITAADVDSLKLFLQMTRDSFTGDSLIPMGLEVYRLNKNLPYPIYSDFNPEGYYNKADLLASSMYTASTINEPDSIKKITQLIVTLPMPLSLGRELYQAYVNDPGTFADPAKFCEDVFKGIYVRSSYGSGRISDFTQTSMRLYYHRTLTSSTGNDSIVRYYGDYFAVTPEVIVNNNISYQPDQSLKDMIAAGDHIIAAPAGFETDITFPAPEIIRSYNRYADDLRVLNTLTFSIPADSIANEFRIGPPPYALLVLKSKKHEFFEKNSINDNVTSFYAAYDATNKCYSFNSMREYILDLIEKENITPDDYTFSLVPVQVTLEASANSGYGQQSYIVSDIAPYVSKPAMAKISLKDAKIKLTFSAGNHKIL